MYYDVAHKARLYCFSLLAPQVYRQFIGSMNTNHPFLFYIHMQYSTYEKHDALV